MPDANVAEKVATRHYVTKSFVSLFIQNFLVFAGFSVFNVIPDHLAHVGASKTYIGFYMNLNALALVLLVIPLSRFSDRLGRKRIMVWGYATSLAFACLSFFFAEDLVALALLRVLGTLLFCAVFTIQTTEAFSLIPRERRISGMAIYGTSGLVANPVASFIAERTLDGLGARWLFAVVFAFHALGMILALAHRFHEPGEEAERGSFLALLGRPELAPLFALTFVLGGAFAVFSTFLANLTRERLGAVNVSLFFASFSVVAVLIRLFLGPFIEKRKATSLTAVCYASIAASFFMAFGLRTAGALIPIGILYGIGHSVLFPLLSTLFVNSGRDGERLVLNNLYAATNTLGNIIIAVAFGAVADAFGVPSVFLCLTILCAAMVPFGYFRLARPVPASAARR